MIRLDPGLTEEEYEPLAEPRILACDGQQFLVQTGTVDAGPLYRQRGVEQLPAGDVVDLENSNGVLQVTLIGSILNHSHGGRWKPYTGSLSGAEVLASAGIAAEQAASAGAANKLPRKN